jgi:hypothetical protein
MPSARSKQSLIKSQRQGNENGVGDKETRQRTHRHTTGMNPMPFLESSPSYENYDIQSEGYDSAA